MGNDDEAEFLDPGYAQQTPDGDNFLLDFFRTEAASWEAWAAAAGGVSGRNEEFGFDWADLGTKSIFGNPVHLSRPLDSSDQLAAIEAIRAAYAGREGGGFMFYSAFPTGDLSHLGLHVIGHPPLMVRPAGPPPSLPNTDLRIVEVTDIDELNEFDHTLCEAFPVDEELPWTGRSLLSPGLLDDPRFHHYNGYAPDGQAVATAAAFVSPTCADVTVVSTRKEYRGRGYGEAMTWAATLADATKPAVLFASDAGKPIYRRMGYLPLMRITLWAGRRPSL